MLKFKLIFSTFLAFTTLFSLISVANAKEIKVYSLGYIPTKACSQAQITNSNFSVNYLGTDYPQVTDGNRLENKLGIASNLDSVVITVNNINANMQAIRFYFWYIDFPESYKVTFYNGSTVVGTYNESNSLTKDIVYSQDPPINYVDAYLPNQTYVTSAKFEVIDYRVTSTNGDQINIYEVELYSSSGDSCIDTAATGTVHKALNGTGTEKQQVIDRINEYNQSLINDLKAGSKNYLSFNLLNHTNFFKAEPVSSTFYPKFDYQKILTQDINVCDLVDNQGVSQIWIWSYHNDGTTKAVPDESNMAMGTISRDFWNNGSKYSIIPNATFGDISNSSGQNDMPTCQNTYTLYNPTWTIDYDNAVHNHMHQVENIWGFLGGNNHCTDGFVNGQCVNNKGEANLFWDYFVGKKYNDLAGNWICGNTHFAPNSTLDYIYNSTNVVSTICENWDPSKVTTATKTNLSCNNWSCTADNSDTEFYKWWLNKVPNQNNNLKFQGSDLTNWFDAYADLDEYMANYGKSLTTANQTNKFDLNHDGNVNFLDAEILAEFLLGL